MTTLGNWGSLYCHLRAVTCLCAQPAWPFVLPHPFHLSLSCGRGLYGGKFHDHLILNCAKSGAWIGVWLLLPFFGELLIYLLIVWEALEPFYLLTVLLLPKPLTVQRLDRNPLSSMLLEIFNCFCAVVKHHNFVFYHCAESQRYLRAEKEMLGNCCKKPGRSAESFQLSFLTKVTLWAEACSGWKGFKYRKWLISPSCLTEPGRIRTDCSSCFLHSSVHCVLWVCVAAEDRLIVHQGCDGNVQAGEPDPFPSCPPLHTAELTLHSGWASCWQSRVVGDFSSF